MSDLMRRFAEVSISVDLGLTPHLVIFDPEEYQLWYKIYDDRDEIYVSFRDKGSKKVYPLVQWMNEVKRVVQKYAPPE